MGHLQYPKHEPASEPAASYFDECRNICTVAGLSLGVSSTHSRQCVQGPVVPLKKIECGVYGDLTMIYPKPYSIYLRGTMDKDELSAYQFAGFGVQ